MGEQTNKNRRIILPYELRYALRYKLPIILAYKGYTGLEAADERIWNERLYPMLPKTLRDWEGEKYCLVSPFTRAAVITAIHTYSNISLPLEGYTWHWRIF